MRKSLSSSGKYLIALIVLWAASESVQAQTITFTELNYHSDSIRNASDWLELYNYGANPVLLTGWYLKDEILTNRWNVPVGTVVAPGSYLVISTDVAAFSIVYPEVLNVIGQPDFRFSNAGERLSLFNAANTRIASMAYQDSLPWQEGSDGHGRTLQVVNPTGDLDDPMNWFDGCMFGSPGQPYSPCDPPLVFSEINYNSPLSPDAGDWVELHNRSSTAINLGNWTFKDQRDTNFFIMPPGTVLGAGQYLVLTRELALFQAVHPGVSNAIGSFGFNLSGDGEVARLFDQSGAIAYSVVYNDAPPWPQPPDGLGPTLELIDPAGNMNRYYNWFDGCPLGSPGGPFVPWCWTAPVTEQNMPEPELSLTPQGYAVSVPGTYRAMVSLLDLTGRARSETLLEPGMPVFLDASTLPAGVYLVQVRNESGAFRAIKVFWPGY